MRVLLRSALDAQSHLVWDFLPLDAKALSHLQSLTPPTVFTWPDADKRVRLRGRAAIHVAARLRDRGVEVIDRVDR